ncbi:MAG TPA: DUF2585 family protein [Candidatus Nanoarchaeia archaeon]|nr:DUF2585 family protein [Candidatus Nanoarchaeia archaeon]
MKEKIKYEAIKRYRWIIVGAVIIFVLAAFIELKMGRSYLGPDGKFGWWEGDIWSSEQSQRFADPYSFTHIIHGLLFYLILWLAARKMPVRYRFLIAVIIEAVWEIMENSPIIIDRYRAVTISLGYVGDSVINSLSDILMMIIGFLLAARWKVWMSVALVILIELILLLLMKDNLTLNIVMLVYPIEAIKSWQMAGHVIP